MKRCSTSIHGADLPLNTKDLSDLEIVYTQDEEEVFTKTMKDCICDGYEVMVELTPKDTKKFKDTIPVEIQVILTDRNGRVWPSDTIRVPVGRFLKGGKSA